MLLFVIVVVVVRRRHKDSIIHKRRFDWSRFLVNHSNQSKKSFTSINKSRRGSCFDRVHAGIVK